MAKPAGPAACAEPSCACRQRAKRLANLSPFPAGGAAAVTTVDYPAGGYWGLPPAARVAMLHALVHDALETDELR